MTWQEILDDPDIARLEYRVESDRWGNLVMSPPPSSWHGDVQSEIAALLARLLPHGRCTTECPIQTNEGVRACDVAWASRTRRNSTNRKPVFTVAPEICVEVQSPPNSLPQIMERRDWFLAAGASEFWYCDPYGRMHFYDAKGQLAESEICPDFPGTVTVD